MKLILLLAAPLIAPFLETQLLTSEVFFASIKKKKVNNKIIDAHLDGNSFQPGIIPPSDTLTSLLIG